jgi:hypothetical protein
VTDRLTYYASHGPISDPGNHARLLDGLPTDIRDLCAVVQGLVVHPFLATQYGLAPSEIREEETQLRLVSAMLSRIVELDDRPLSEARPVARKLVGNCRDHTMLLVAILRHQHVPARARCGFGAYFNPGKYEDHWVCEYWNAADGRWQLVDAQLDAHQRQVLNIQFDTCDVPRDRFVVAGRGWQMCRTGGADPDAFGLSGINEHGLWWVRQNLVRDMAALNKMEMLPWDGWGLAEGIENEVSHEVEQLLDRVAVLTQGDNDAFSQLRVTYETTEVLRLPATIRSNGPGGGRLVEVPVGA